MQQNGSICGTEKESIKRHIDIQLIIKGTFQISVEKIDPSIKGVETIGYIQLKKISFHKTKNKFQIKT